MTNFNAGQLIGLIQTLLLSGMLAVSIAVQNTAFAAQPHEGELLLFDEALTLPTLLATTVARHPQAGVLDARLATVDAETKYGTRWLPDSTRLTTFHLSDQSLDDIGLYESEVSLSIPLWLPGEKKAQSRLGEALSSSHASEQAAFRLRISGELRLQLWQLKLAVQQWQLAVEHEQRLGKVLKQITLFAESGELSRADQLATMEEFAIWKGETMLLEAQYMDAIRVYRSLTGLESIPAMIDETLSALEAIDSDHPALRNAMNRKTQASAATEIVRRQSNNRPSVDMFWRGSRGDAQSPDVDALGIGFMMPIGKSPRSKPAVARAFEVFAKAQANLHEIKRELELQLHEAEHVLHTNRERLENSDIIVEAATERFQLDKLAFELGEFSTHEWLRRLSQLKKIEQSHELLLIQQGAAIAAYNQAVGESL